VRAIVINRVLLNLNSQPECNGSGVGVGAFYFTA
jgi:hypothetical protein